MQLLGLHHVTAISARIGENHRFYTHTLGMRLVKRSVNQDDVSAYHLFYADARGTPGTDLTFFDWPMPPQRRGTRSIVRTSLRVAGADTVEWWRHRLEALGVRVGEVVVRDERTTLDVEDPEGQRLSLVDDGGSGEAFPWEQSPVPAERQIRGLGPVWLSVPDLAGTDAILERALGMRRVRDYPHPEEPRHRVHVFEMGQGGAGAELHVAVQPELPVARQGAGGVHHLALRTPTFEEYDEWVARIGRMGIPNSGPVDRFWFRSLYFREPNGILFEIATDGPGFDVDEDAGSLGERLILPPFLESRREAIVARLKPLD